MIILALEMASTGNWHCASLYQCTFVPYISRQTAEDIKASVQLIVNMLTVDRDAYRGADVALLGYYCHNYYYYTRLTASSPRQSG